MEGEGGEDRKRKEGFDSLGNVGIAFVFIAIGKITFIELDAYPRTVKWKREGRSVHTRYIHYNFLSRMNINIIRELKIKRITLL